MEAISGTGLTNIGNKGSESIKLLEALLLLVVFIAPIWPRNAAIFIAGLPNINLTRMIIFTLVFMWLLSLLGFRHTIKPLIESYRSDRTLFHCLIAFFALKFLSILSSDNIKSSFFAFTDDLFGWLLLFIATVTILNNSRQLYRILFILGISSVLISSYGLYELYLGHNLLDPLVLNKKILEISPRGHRIRSVFNNTLILAEYQIFIIPIVLLLYKFSKGLFIRNIYIFALILSISNIIFTRSRGAMLIALIIAIGFFILKSREMVKDKHASTKLLIAYTSFVTIMMLIILFTPFLINITKGRTLAERTSSHGRISQLQKGIPLALKHPILGYGQGRSGYALTHGLKHTSIDNYFLVLSLESGLLALILFVYILYRQLKLSYVLYNKTEGFHKNISGVIGISLAGTFIFMTVLSIDYIFPLIFIFFAILSFIQKSHTHISSTHMDARQL